MTSKPNTWQPTVFSFDAWRVRVAETATRSSETRLAVDNERSARTRDASSRHHLSLALRFEEAFVLDPEQLLV